MVDKYRIITVAPALERDLVLGTWVTIGDYDTLLQQYAALEAKNTELTRLVAMAKLLYYNRNYRKDEIRALMESAWCAARLLCPDDAEIDHQLDIARAQTPNAPGEEMEP